MILNPIDDDQPVYSRTAKKQQSSKLTYNTAHNIELLKSEKKS